MFEISKLVNSSIPRGKLDELIEINNKSAYYSLILSEEDILKLISERNAVLRYAERLEFGFDTMELLIDSFYKSPYINQFEYADILNGLQFIFYTLKNDVGDALTDEELISLMAEMFDGVCGGSLELLAGRGAEHILEFAKLRLNKLEKDGFHISTQNVRTSSASITIAYTEEQELLLRQSLAVMLEEFSLRYTKGRSFSIDVEAAQCIVRSVMFAARLAGEHSVSEDKLRLAYYRGLEIIDDMIRDSRRLYAKVIDTRLEIVLNSYNETIDGMRRFFDSYDKEFASAEIPAEISYYPALCDNGLVGVEFIKQYLYCLLLENEVCALFDINDIERLLAACEEKHGKGRALLLPNIFELLMINSLFAVIVGKRPEDVILTENDSKALCGAFVEISVIENAINYFLQYFKIGANSEAARYIMKYYADKLHLKLKYAEGSAADIAVFEKQWQHGVLRPGEKMQDLRFAMLVERLNGESELSNKIKIINENVNSIYDIIDILSAEVFCGGEYRVFYSSLTDVETKLLIRIVKNTISEIDGKSPVQIGAESIRPSDMWVKELINYYEGW